MAEITGGLPYLLPGSVLALVLSLPASGPVGRWLAVRRTAAWIGLFSLGVVISSTLSPLDSGSGIAPGAVRACDLSRMWPASLSDLAASLDVALNILLFVLLGWAVGVAPRSMRKLVVLLLVATLPFVIEAVQLHVSELRRGCESADVADNLTGLAIGLVAGSVIRLLSGVRATQQRAG